MKKEVLFLLMGCVIVFGSGAKEFYNPLDIQNSLFVFWGGIAALVFMITILITALVYMLGNFLMNEKLKNWAKSEVVELFYSAVIFSIIVVVYLNGTEIAKHFAYSIDGFAANIVCNTNNPLFNTFMHNGKPIDYGYGSLPCHLRVAKNFMATLFYEAAGFVKAVGITSSWYSFLSSFSIDFTLVGSDTYLSGGTLNIAPLAFLGAKNNALTFLFENGVRALLLIRFQEILINFIGTALFPVFLTAGLILRIFTITRKLGGLLMAIALSLYFIYPIFYIVGSSIYTSIILEQNYPESTPLKERSALAKTFVDFGSLPKKPGDNYAEDFTTKTDADAVSTAFLGKMELLSSSTECTETLEHVNTQKETIKDMPLGDILLSLSQISPGRNNILLGTWLSTSYGKGAKWDQSASFQSVLIGIDVLAKTLFFSLFFSFLSIFVTLATIKHLSPMLGGDTELAGLTHLI